MALTKETTSSIVGKFGKSAADTGNTNVQIALLTERIKQLTAHCKAFPKDTTASRGLLKYLQNTNLEGYRALIKELGIRK